MKFEFSIEEYTTYLLKLSYLLVKDKEVAAEIVQDAFSGLYVKYRDTLQLEKVKTQLVQMVVKRCAVYIRSWRYRKLQLVKNKKSGIPTEIEQPGLINGLFNLPRSEREIVSLYHFASISTTEIAALLNMPVATVRAKLQKAEQKVTSEQLPYALGDWEVAGIALKGQIYEIIVNNPKKRKPFKMKRLVASVVLLILVIAGASIYSMLQEEKPVVAEVEEEAQKPILEMDEFRMYDERTLKITEYEMYFNDPSFMTLKQAEYSAFLEITRKFALFNHLENYGYKWAEDRHDFYIGIEMYALEYELKKPHRKAYYEKMFTDLSITKEEYVEYYLLINREYQFLEQDMYSQSIGLDETGSYPQEKAEAEYMALLGITKAQLVAMEPIWDFESTSEKIEMGLPFPVDAIDMKVIKNDTGELVFESSSNLYFSLRNQHSKYFNSIMDELRMDFTRYTFNDFKETLAAFEGETSELNQVIGDLVEILKLFEQSVEWGQITR